MKRTHPIPKHGMSGILVKVGLLMILEGYVKYSLKLEMERKFIRSLPPLMIPCPTFN